DAVASGRGGRIRCGAGAIRELERKDVFDRRVAESLALKSSRAQDQQPAAALADERARQRELLTGEQVGIDVGEHGHVVGQAPAHGARGALGAVPTARDPRRVSRTADATPGRGAGPRSRRTAAGPRADAPPNTRMRGGRAAVGTAPLPYSGSQGPSPRAASASP